MTLTIRKPRGFSLAAASDFYSGFTPGSGMAAAAVDHFTLVFRLDRTFEAVGAALREEGDAIVVDATTTDTETLRAQLARILGLDADGDAWRAVGERDAVVGAMMREFPGFFTAAKASPYDAAAWGVIAARTSIAAAAKLKAAIAIAHGDTVRVRGRTHHVFPSPSRVLGIEDVPGLPSEKLARLHAVASAALEGALDADRLRAMPESDALAELQTIRGVGPWTAAHVLYRGAAPADALPTAEPRVLRGFAHAYGLASPTWADLARAAEAWRPFRMWVCVLLSRHLARTGDWRAPGLAKERAQATKRAAQ